MYSQREFKLHEIEPLLRKHVQSPGIIAHSYAVGFVAVDAALRSVLAGEKCNPRDVYIGARLHDIAKEIDPEEHPMKGRDILLKEGLSKEIAEMVGKHGLALEIAKTRNISGDYILRTLKEKLVAYADFCVVNTTWTTVDQRIKCLQKVYESKMEYEPEKSKEKLNNLRNAIPRIKALERELMQLWARSTYLSTYVYDVRRFTELQEQKLIF